jgi:hypothetical protein
VKPGSSEGRRQADKEAKDSKASTTAAYVAKFSARLGIEESEFKAFFSGEKKAGHASEEAATIWNRIFDRLGKPEAESLKTSVSAYIALKRSGVVDDFHIRESDLLEIDSTWSPTQKANFAKALARTAVLAKSKSFPTAEAAFEAALKEMGILDKYKEGCKI